MTNFRSIDIDFEVHKRIELERNSFSESPNDVLRRLLGVEIPAAITAASTLTPTDRVQGRPWQKSGVALPHGTELQMNYNGRLISGKIIDGKWLVEGSEYTSPSGAASGAARTKEGTFTNLDGWREWRVKRPGDVDWIRLYVLRTKS